MSEEKTAPPPAKNGGGASKFRSPLFIWLAAIVLAVLLYFGIGMLANIFTHESTDDAFIAGHITSVAPRVSGQVIAVHVRDNEMVHSNDLLVEIDPSDYEITMGEKQAAAVSQLANFRAIVAAYELMRVKVATAEATARVAAADAAAAESTAENARTNFDRISNLLKQKTVSQQEYDNALAANTTAQANFKSAQETVEEDNSKVDEAQKQCDAAFAEKDVAFAQINEANTNVASAQLNLSYTRIFAPTDGRVTRKAVEVGDYLETGQQIMSIVPADVWVVANFKESQLKKMHPGQPVTVAIDALGGREFSAKVDSVQAGSGAQFSLLPPENATGNFVKVVQRVPVKIVFTEALPPGHVIGPGLSVQPSVQVSAFVFPAWASALIAVVVAVVSAFVFLWIAGPKSNGA